MLVPYIIDEENGIKSSMDPYSRLLKDRVIMIEGEINTSSANLAAAQLLLLESLDPDADITMYINSGGGDVLAGTAILDAMDFINCDVCTVAMGLAGSMASVILANGTPGKRYALKRSTVMIHRLSGGTEGDYHSMKSSWDHIERAHKKLLKEYVRMTAGKRTEKELEELMRYDNFLTPEEALEIGLVDRVISTRRELENGQ